MQLVTSQMHVALQIKHWSPPMHLSRLCQVMRPLQKCADTKYFLPLYVQCYSGWLQIVSSCRPHMCAVSYGLHKEVSLFLRQTKRRLWKLCVLLSATVGLSCICHRDKRSIIYNVMIVVDYVGVSYQLSQRGRSV